MTSLTKTEIENTGESMYPEIMVIRREELTRLGMKSYAAPPTLTALCRTNPAQRWWV